MKLNKILKGKTRSQMVDDFAAQYYITKEMHEEERVPSSYDFRKGIKRLARGMNRPQKFRSWIVSIFMWIFAISWMVQAGIALDGKFFWFPIEPGTPSMLSFINIFWVILWFVLPLVLIIYYVIKLIDSYNNNDSY